MNFIFARPLLLMGASPPPDGVSLLSFLVAPSLDFVSIFGNTIDFTGFFHRLSLSTNVLSIVLGLIVVSRFWRFHGSGVLRPGDAFIAIVGGRRGNFFPLEPINTTFFYHV